MQNVDDGSDKLRIVGFCLLTPYRNSPTFPLTPAKALVVWEMKMADEAKHTTGPWSVHVETEQHGMYRGTSAVYICSEAGWPDGQLARVNVQDGLGEREANAHLLAAAPKLLAAVRALIGDVRWLKTGIANRVECAHCGRQYDETKDETLPDFCDDECPGEIGRAAIAKAANT